VQRWPSNALPRFPPPIVSLTPRTHLLGMPPSSSRRRRRFPKLPKPNPSLNLPFPFVETPSGYISRGRTSFRLHPTPSRCQRSSWDATASLGLYRASTVRHSEHRTVSGPITSLVLTLVSSPCSPLHPSVFLSRDNAVNRAFAFSGDGAAAERRRGSVPAERHRRLIPDPIRAVQIKSNGPDLKIPVRPALLLKRP
jgi:hypothetical protein